MADVALTALAAAIVLVPCAVSTVAAWSLLDERGRMSPHAHWLGRRVMVRKYDASDWEPATVVAVSHKGALCVRRDDERRGWWMDARRVPGRVVGL